MTTAQWSQVHPSVHDVRMVVADMDGTLLDGDGHIPEDFWQVYELLRGQGIRFVPASGRQYATLRDMFAARGGDMAMIAENGNVIAVDGSMEAVSGIDADTARHVVTLARGDHGRDLGVVVCCRDEALIERGDRPFVEECAKYYHALRVVDDVREALDAAVRDGQPVVKMAVFDFDDAQPVAESLFGALRESHQVVVSGAHWVDVMDRRADKACGVRALQERWQVDVAHTMAFGDYINDVGMLQAASWSYAMANAHPQVVRCARYGAPSNVEHGVLQVLRAMLEA